MLRPILLCFALIAASVGPAAAAKVNAVGQFKDWRVYTERVNGDLVCFASTSATDKAPKKVSHGDVSFYVASWRSGAGANQPSLKVGYDLRPDLPPEMVVGRQRWRMYSADNEGFLEDKDERAVVNALKKGSQLRVEAVSSRGTRTAYYFSLRGSSAAIDRARSACR
ncbi:MAG: hypothetical protein AAF719_08410 [Pseudomonadota bacterium]